jgi:hypothetical protein
MYFKYFDEIPYVIDGYAKQAIDLMRAVLPDNVDLGDFYIFQKYTVSSGDIPESAAYQLYQRADYYWVLLVINNMVNPYLDWPMSDEEVELYATKKYGADALYDVHHYYWLNDPYHKDYSWLDEVDRVDPIKLRAQFVVPMTNLEYEIEQNINRRDIVAINPRVVSQFVDAYNNALQEKTLVMIFANPTKYGDLKEFTIKIDGYDASEAVVEARIFQSIFTPTWTAQFQISDTTNLLMRMPIKPGSKIEATFETFVESAADDKKTYNLIVYRIGEKQLLGSMHQKYVLFCAPEAFYTNQKKRISKAYTNLKATDAVNQIVGEFLDGSVETEDADQSVSTIVSNWSPFNAIAWFTKHATNKNAADYVFFQTDEDKYEMKPMEKLYNSNDESTGVTFIQRIGESKDNIGNYLTDLSHAFSHYQVEHFDGVSNLSSGYYKNKKVSYDLINKQWEEKVFKFGDDCQEDATYKNWDTDLFDDAEDANITFMPKHPGMNDSGDTYLDPQDTWNGSRKSAIQKFEQEKLTIQLPGSVGFYKYIGKNCKVDLPSHQDMDNNQLLDKYRRGKYLILNVAHIIGRVGYVCNIEMAKKRLDTELEPGDLSQG